MIVQVECENINEAMNRAAMRLRVVLMAAWGESDERFACATEELSQAVWKMANQIYEAECDGPNEKLEYVELENDRLTGLTSAAMGRVLTWIDAIFPVVHQCEAIKSLARTIVWDIRQDIVKNACGISDEKK